MKKTGLICALLAAVFVLPGEEMHDFLPFAADLHLRKAGFTLGYSYKYRQAVWGGLHTYGGESSGPPGAAQ